LPRKPRKLGHRRHGHRRANAAGVGIRAGSLTRRLSARAAPRRASACSSGAKALAGGGGVPNAVACAKAEPPVDCRRLGGFAACLRLCLRLVPPLRDRRATARSSSRRSALARAEAPGVVSPRNAPAPRSRLATRDRFVPGYVPTRL